jgi:hypothetical protein
LSSEVFVIYVIATLTVVVLVQSWLLWRLVRMMSVMRGFDERLSRCTQGLSLLVDTSEAGFSMLGGELARLGATPPKKIAAKSTNRRIVNAARRGRAVPDIAAREGLSEGEVRLRMHLADNAPVESSPPSGEGRGSVRS